MRQSISWLNRFFSHKSANKPLLRQSRRRSTHQCSLQLERLEDRLAPATIITVVNAANGTGSLDAQFALQNGTINPGDGGGGGAQPETLSTGALVALPAADSISVTAQNSILFNDLGGTLTLASATGQSVAFAVSTSTGTTIAFANTANTLATSGAALSFVAGTDLTLANLDSAGGNVDLTSGSNGAGALAAQNISTGPPGNGAAINANGQGDVVVGTLHADTLGITSNAGSVSTRAGSVLQGSSLSIDADTGIDVHTLVTHISAYNQVSGDIAITQNASPATPLISDIGGIVNGENSTLASSGGAITVINLGSSIDIEGLGGDVSTPGVQSNNGVIELLATDLIVNNLVTSGTARTVLGNSVANTPIDLGTDTNGSIGLTQTELNEVTAAVLQIGSASAGPINLSQPIANTAGWDALHLISGSTIGEAAAASLTVDHLALDGAAGVALAGTGGPGNDVADLAGSVTAPGAAFTFVNATDLAVGTEDGDNGVTAHGSVLIGNSAADGTLSINNVVQNLGAAATSIHLFADNLAFNATVNGSSGVVELTPATLAEPITLGTTVLNTLSLLQSDLDQITAGVLQIGSVQSTGNISFTAPITAPAGWSDLDLETSGAVLGAGAITPDVTVGTLVVNAGAGVGTAGIALNTSVAILTALGGVGGVNVANLGALSIVGAPNGLAATAGDITVSTTGALTVVGAVDNSAANGNVNLSAGPSINVAAVVTALGGTVTLQGDAFDVGPTTIALDGSKVAAKQAVVRGGGFGDTLTVGPSLTTPITVDGGFGPGFGAAQFDTFNLNLNGGLQGSKLSYNFSLTYSPAGFFGTYINLADALGHAFQNITIYDIEKPVPTAGYQFDPSHNVLGVSANNFTFTQAPDAATLVADGNTEVFPQPNVPRILASGASANAAAALTTNDSIVVNVSGNTFTSDSLTASDAAPATEFLVLGRNSGTLYRLSASANAAEVIELGGFHKISAQLTYADAGMIVGTPGLVNRFVSSGLRSTMNSGTPAQLAQLDQGNQSATANYFIAGAHYVYGYSAGPSDSAYHYDGSGPSTLLIEGMAYSYMSGTDQNLAFFNEAVGFSQTLGIAKNNAHDIAYLYDTTSGDVFVGFSAYSALYHTNTDSTVSEYDNVTGFELVFAFATVGNDSAVNYSPSTVSITGFTLFG